MSAVADLAFVRARSEASARFVSENSERISWLCHRMSERFLDGGRLLAFESTAQERSDVRHVAVDARAPGGIREGKPVYDRR